LRAGEVVASSSARILSEKAHRAGVAYAATPTFGQEAGASRGSRTPGWWSV